MMMMTNDESSVVICGHLDVQVTALGLRRLVQQAVHHPVSAAAA
jgi:hypothetical protein